VEMGSPVLVHPEVSDGFPYNKPRSSHYRIQCQETRSEGHWLTVSWGMLVDLPTENGETTHVAKILSRAW